MAFAAIHALLKDPIQAIHDNRAWVSAKEFPYTNAPGPYSYVYERNVRILKKFPFTMTSGTDPVFVIGMPIHISTSDTYENFVPHVNRIIRDIAEQTFSDNPDSSVGIAKRRIGVILGFNRHRSLQPSHNEAFQEILQKLQESVEAPITVGMVGFQWTIEYVRKDKYPEIIYTAEKAHLLFRARFPNLLSPVENNLYEIVPYRKIRDTIFHSSLAQELEVACRKIAPKAPLYGLSLDSDFVRLNPSGRGLLE